MDWSSLGFKYRKTNTVLTSLYRDGAWGEVNSQSDDHINITVGSPSFHYGMECFEGLKAFRGVDGKVRIFRMDENYKRMCTSASFLGIPAPTQELFYKMCTQAVKENIDFLPPYGYKASLYIRPLLITTDPSVNLVPQNEGIMFMVFTFPVGTYGPKILEPIKTVIARDYDRAAPNGSGSFKVGGNYACAMLAEGKAVRQGYTDVLFITPSTENGIDEFSSANFFAVKGNEYITPLSKSILPSITNKSLCTVAEDLGMKVSRRVVTVDELGDFDEVGECGTAVVLSPVAQIDDKVGLEHDEVTHSYKYSYDQNSVSRKLYETITGIQFGEIEDKHGWCTIIG